MERRAVNAGRLTPRRARVLHASILSLALLAAAWAASSSATSRPSATAFGTLTVLNNADGGPGSLRQAIADAVGGDTINFSPALNGQTITLTSGQLLINKALTITGPGASLLTVSGNNASRVFDIGNAVQISGLTISNGRTTATGGGIHSSAPLTLDDCAVSNNVADSSFGGGIFSDGGELTIRDSTISGNQTVAGSNGGGIAVFGGTPSITNSTISGNSALSGSSGGGIFISSSLLTVTACTITNNTALQGGGIRVGSGTAVLRSNIVAGNSAGTGPDISGAATSQGFNLVGNNSGATITPTTGDQTGTSGAPINPLLGPLQNNGGPTPTHYLDNGSPARDAGDDSLTGPPFNLSTDQRGSNRRRGPHVDAGAVEEQGFFVTNTNDSGAGSLRQAINDANNTPGLGLITFSIPGAGVQTIKPLTQLPDITDPVYIDGYTQPGASPNTLAVGNDAVLLIELDGTDAGTNSNGLVIRSGGSTVKGLVINRFDDRGIAIQPNGGNFIEGCFVGTDATGTFDLGNRVGGIFVFVSSNNTIGGTTPAARNVVSGNGGTNGNGIALRANANNNTVQGNYVGTDADGVQPLGNDSLGILINSARDNVIGGTTAAARNVVSGNGVNGIDIRNEQGSAATGNQIIGNYVGTDATGSNAVGNVVNGVQISQPNNTVGGTAAGAGNLISANGGAGVSIISNATGNRILGNSIHSNSVLGIDLGGDGVTQNDAGDSDAGANRRQNFPALTSATITSGTAAVAWTLNSTPNSTFFVEFFRGPSCDPSGNGEGQTSLGLVSVNTDAGGNATRASSFPGVAAGEFITATATNVSTNDTSEFSPCMTAQNATTLAVTNTNDNGPGSLRQAIADANDTPGLQTINFNIPGAGVHTIQPTSALPTITGPVIIDGYTQPGSSQNTLAVGDDAVLLVELSGASAGSSDGLTITGGSSTVRGLVINRFARGGIRLFGSSGNVIGGNFIGTNASGTAALGNIDQGVLVESSGSNVIGGATPAARNLISGNAPPGVASPGISISGNVSTNNAVLGNYIGTNAAGTAAVGNGTGVRASSGATGNTVGGASASERNVISGNIFGVLIETSGNFVRGNFIGTDAAGTAALGNVGVGVLITGPIGVPAPVDNNAVGGTGEGEGNVIAFNGAAGVRVADGAGNRILSNSIHSNGLLGIDLFPDGLTPNDAGDADTGANNRQNFPVLTSAPIVGGSATVFGTLGSTPDRNFTVQFFANASCDASGNGEGRRLLGSANVTTDASGNAALAAGPFPGVASGEAVTANATDDATGDTSEFSKCVTAATATALTVTNTSDDGEGSLRRALDTVEDGGTIDFAPEVRGTVTLASELVVNRHVTIVGPGASLLNLSGDGERRLLNVGTGGVVSVFKLSFSNGSADGDGGAILNAGTLRLTDCAVSASKAARGGAVYNSGSLNVEGCAFNSNSADEGGGLHNAGAADASGSTFSGNVARSGGGIFSRGALTFTNSTVADNRSTERGAGMTLGVASRAALASVTIAGNELTGPNGSGGGIFNLAPAAALSLRNSIVADNTDTAGADDISGAVNSLDFNLIGSAAGANVSGLTEHNVMGKPPRLGPLRNNGGPTDTRALLSGSPALDAGDDTLTTDQRGRPRKVDGDSDGGARADIGAFESGFSIPGRLQDSDTDSPVGRVTVTLSGSSVSRSALSSGEGDARQNNFTIMDVPEGSGYQVTTAAPLLFAYAFPEMCVDVSAGGVLTECGTQTVITRLFLVGTKQANRFVKIEGRVADDSGRPFGGVTVTLTGPKTVVLSLPECTAQQPDCGRYKFENVPTGADYTLTPAREQQGFTAQTFDNANAFDNGRGGADITLTLGSGDFNEFKIDFKGGGVAPPPPSDDFDDASTSISRFKNGVLSLAPESFDPAVNVVQGKGQLQITPPDSGDAATRGANESGESAAAAQVEKFNGYVSVRGIDLNTSTNVSVRADEPIFERGAQTVFSVGSDSENFYRIRVGAPSSGLGPIAATSQADAGATTQAADAPAIFFEALRGGSKFQRSAAFDRSVDAFWRLRFEPPTPTPPPVCTDASAQGFVLFETSADRTAWTTRYCAPLGTGRTNVAAELLAGVVGDTEDPGTARFSDYRVSDSTGIGFGPPATPEIDKGAESVELKLVRAGDDEDVSSAASVVLKVAGSANASAPSPCANASAPPCKVFFAPGQRAAVFSFANPARDAADGSTLSLVLDAPAGGALDEGSGALTLTVKDRGFRGNRIGESGFFAEQHYCDFLNRPADDAGRRFWTNEIEKCGTGTEAAQCREVRRINVSAAFFLSIEFKETGFFVYRLHEVSLGRMPSLSEMLDGAGRVGLDVVVGRDGWEGILERNKRDFVAGWIERADFKQAFGSLKSAEFVDKLYANAGVAPSPGVRSHLVLELTTGGMTRAQVLRAVAEDPKLSEEHFNRAFVLMQYFGYLRRDPDEVGFNFWLDKLNEFNGDFVKAEMVKAFLSSDEYRNRFKDKPKTTCGP